MNRWTLFKQMLPGLLPLFVFVIADELWGTEIGLYVAVGFGLLELLITFIKERRLEKFILADILLLVGLGLVSILLENDIFFKLKPALIQMILCIILGISAYSSNNIIMLMSKRFMKNLPPEIQEKQVENMKAPIRVLFWMTLCHTGLVIYAALAMSKEAWVFISGVLFYIIFAIFFLIQLVYQKLKFRQ